MTNAQGSLTASDFFAAVRAGSIDRVRELVTQTPALAHARSEGATALHFAAIAGDRAMVDLLLTARADVNARDDTYQMTPIAWANEEGDMTMILAFSRIGKTTLDSWEETGPAIILTLSCSISFRSRSSSAWRA